MIGLDIEAGEPKHFATAAGSVKTYGHFAQIETLGLAFESMVFFFAGADIRKNLLGQTGWLDRVRLGVVHYDQELYLAPYDPEIQ